MSATIDTPLGTLTAELDANGALTRLEWGSASAGAATEPPAALARQLGDYFAGRGAAFDFPLAPRGSEFQLRVWRAVSAIPAGTTATYGEIAAVLGMSGGARAVGRANASNPIAVLVPCHRVVGSDGQLRGYTGGMDRKRALLTLEAALREMGSDN